jgi:low affinity Fe/Cu permease
MVFLIQNTQNRDTKAIQIKLAEVILALEKANDRIAAGEDFGREELQQIHDDLKQRARRPGPGLYGVEGRPKLLVRRTPERSAASAL